MANPELRKCLILLDEGKIEDVNVNELTKLIQRRPAEADYLQYKLLTFCRADVRDKEHEERVFHLSRLCYNEKSIAAFSSMELFVGCVCGITSYFLKRDMYEKALELSKVLKKKTDSIIEAVNNSSAIKHNLFSLHHYYILKAEEVSKKVATEVCSNSQLPWDLVHAALEVLQFIKTEDQQIGKKLIRNMIFFYSSVQQSNEDSIWKTQHMFFEILRHFIPHYKETDFLLCCISKLNYVSTADDLVKMKNNLRRNIYMILIFTSQHNRDSMKRKQLMKMWDIVLDFFISPLQVTKQYENLKSAIGKIALHKDKTINNLYFIILSILINHGIQVWIKHHSSNWIHVLSPALVKMLFQEMVLPLKDYLGNLSSFCESPAGENEFCVAYVIAMNLCNIVHLIRLCVKHKLDVTLSLVDTFHSAFNNARQIYNDMKVNSSQLCLQRRESSWQNLVIHYTNMIEDLLGYSTVANSSSHLRTSCQDLIREILSSDVTLPFDSKRVRLLFQRWHYANMKMRDFNEAVFVCALFFVTYPQYSDEIMPLWVQIKTEMSKGKEELTIVDAIKMNEERLQELNSQYQKGSHDVKSLLLWELRAYELCASVVLTDSIMAVWSQLEFLQLDMYEEAFAFNCVVAASAASVDSKTIAAHRVRCAEITDRFKLGSDKIRDALYSGHLKYSLFLCELKLLQSDEDPSNSTLSIINYLQEEEEEKIKFGEDVDLNLTCDVMPTSRRLTVKHEGKFVLPLEETVRLWHKTADSIGETSLDVSELQIWMSRMKQVASLLELIGGFHSSLKVWLVYYKIATLSKDSTGKLMALTRIIESCSNAEATGITTEAEDIAKGLASENKEKDVVVRFWLAATSYYLRNKKAAECISYLLKIPKTVESLRSVVSLYICQGRYLSLVSQFLCLYPEHLDALGYPPDTDLRYIAFRAFACLNSGAKLEMTPTENNEMLLAMLEVNMWGADLFGFYQQTSFMRMFLESPYQLAQKLILPTRTAQILLRLAEIDIMNRKLEECQVKLDQLFTILGSKAIDKNKARAREIIPEHLQVHRKTEANTATLRTVSPIRFIDCCDNALKRDPSPFRYYIPKSQNENDKHLPSCKCYPCKNLLAQILIANTRTVETQLCAMKSSIDQARPALNASMNRLKRIEEIQSRQSQEISKSAQLFGLGQNELAFPSDLFFKKRAVQVATAKILLNHAIFELSSGLKTGQFFSVVSDVEKAFKELSFEKELLEWIFLEIRVTALAMIKLEKKTSPKICSPAVQTPRNIAKTPRVTVSQKASVMAPKHRIVKKTNSPNYYASRPCGRRIYTNEDDEVVEQKPQDLTVQPQRFMGKLFPKTPALKLSSPKAGTSSVVPVKTSRRPQQKQLSTVKKNKIQVPVSSQSEKICEKKVKAKVVPKSHMIYESPEQESPQPVTVIKKKPIANSGRENCKGRRLLMDAEESESKEKINENVQSQLVESKILLSSSKTKPIEKGKRTARNESKCGSGDQPSAGVQLAATNAGNKKTFNDSYDLFASFEERLKISEDENCKGTDSTAPTISENSVVVVATVKRVTRSSRK